MLLQDSILELEILTEMQEEADKDYHLTLKSGGIVSDSQFGWIGYLNKREKYLKILISKLQKKSIKDFEVFKKKDDLEFHEIISKTSSGR